MPYGVVLKDVHFFQSLLGKNNLALMPPIPPLLKGGEVGFFPLRSLSTTKGCYPFSRVVGDDDHQNYDRYMLQYDLMRFHSLLRGHVITEYDDQAQAPDDTHRDGRIKFEHQDRHNKG